MGFGGGAGGMPFGLAETILEDFEVDPPVPEGFTYGFSRIATSGPSQGAAFNPGAIAGMAKLPPGAMFNPSNGLQNHAKLPGFNVQGGAKLPWESNMDAKLPMGFSPGGGASESEEFTGPSASFLIEDYADNQMEEINQFQSDRIVGGTTVDKDCFQDFSAILWFKSFHSDWLLRH